jgi:hypothetical protein
MDRAMLAEHLVRAECDIMLGESHLARQRGVVPERWRQGLGVSEAIALLTRLEDCRPCTSPTVTGCARNLGGSVCAALSKPCRCLGRDLRAMP